MTVIQLEKKYWCTSILVKPTLAKFTMNQATLKHWIMSCMCVNERSAVLHSETHNAYLIQSYSLQCDNCTKLHWDFSFTSIKHAALRRDSLFVSKWEFLGQNKLHVDQILFSKSDKICTWGKIWEPLMNEEYAGTVISFHIFTERQSFDLSRLI